MRKNYMNVVRETGAQAATLRGCEKQIVEAHNKIESLEQESRD